MDDHGDDLGDFEAQLRAAEQAVASLADNFVDLAKQDLERMVAALEAAKARQGDNAGQHAEIFTICHDVKGQAGSFGYDLLTRVGGKLCDFVRDRGDTDADALKVIEGHVVAMSLIADRDIRGDGGELGQKLLSKLSSLAGR